ncbi:unnamed protein product, partial [Allacma fusca]
KNVEIVPESWVNSTETLSRFPPKVTLALRNQIQSLIPPKPGWEEFPAIVKHKCATYSGANKCANELMEKDDLESDWTETESVGIWTRNMVPQQLFAVNLLMLLRRVSLKNPQ